MVAIVHNTEYDRFVNSPRRCSLVVDSNLLLVFNYLKDSTLTSSIPTYLGVKMLKLYQVNFFVGSKSEHIS